MGRGALIILEGCDKSGKSTQCKMLVEYLLKKGMQAELWRFPERSTAIGQVINSYIAKQAELDDRAVHLLFSANRWELVSSLKEKIMNGTTLIIDRYAYSGVAFTSAKGLDVEWCKSSDRGLPLPDSVFYMEIPIDEASSRGDFGGERYEVSEFQRKVQDMFMQLMDDSWKVIDARASIEDIHVCLRDEVFETIKRVQKKPLLMSLFTK